MPSGFARIFLASAAASAYLFLIFGGVFAGAVYADYIAWYLTPYFTFLWASNDSCRTHYWPAFHYGLFVLFAPIAGPAHYAHRTRGRAGIRLQLALAAAALAPFLSAVLGWHLYDRLPYLGA